MMAKYRITSPEGDTFEINAPDNATQDQVMDYAQKNFHKATDVNPQPEVTPEPEVMPELSTIENLGHQAGLTARHVIEGAADTVGIFSDPIAGVINEMGGNLQSAHTVGKSVADYAGLPQPENATERVVGDASRLMVGTGGIVKGASKVAGMVTSPIAAKVNQFLASRPGMQAASAAGGGVSGGVARENGAGTGGQLAASIVGAVAAPMAANSIVNAGRSVVNSVRNVISPAQLNERVIQSINQAGVSLDGLPASVRQQLVDDVSEALKTGNQLSPDALRRLADYRALNMTPIRSTLTLNPADVTRDKNMAKLSANSRDPAAQRLANVQNENNASLINTFNTLGANEADDAMMAGSKLISSLQSVDDTAKGTINQAYQAARDTAGRGAALDPHHFTNRANDLLDEALLGGKIPADVRNKLNQIATGKIPLTVDVAEQYKTAIGNLQRASSDPAERLALSKIRQALDETPLIEGQGQQAIDAFNNARKLNRQYMETVENVPALQAIRDGIEPDKFVQKFVLGSNNTTKDLFNLKKVLTPEDHAVVRGQILSYLKSKATNGNADEVANISAAAYNKALKEIGDKKLAMFFSPQDVSTMKALGRVASYEKFQPVGSAVNNSNTAATSFMAAIDYLANNPLIRKIPFGSAAIANPAQDVSVAIGARGSLNAPKALIAKEAPKNQKMIPLGALLSVGSVSGQ